MSRDERVNEKRDEPWRRVTTHWAAWTRKTGLREERRRDAAPRLRRFRGRAPPPAVSRRLLGFRLLRVRWVKSRGNGRVGARIRGKVVMFDFARRWLIARNITRLTVKGSVEDHIYIYVYDARWDENWEFQVWIVNFERFFFFFYSLVIAASCFDKFGSYLILFAIERSYYGYLKYIFTLWYFIRVVTFDFVEDVNC